MVVELLAHRAAAEHHHGPRPLGTFPPQINANRFNHTLTNTGFVIVQRNPEITSILRT
jgi:hypothetical protein